jgi:serine/threonine protein kinase
VTLDAGRTLGHYEILSTLGAGGMGEVYRARDSRLGREVAIKLLLDEVAADPERLARFEREARLLASLNHPHIATLHGFEAEGATKFLVMELVEGETLADRIARGPIALEEAIRISLETGRKSQLTDGG